MGKVLVLNASYEPLNITSWRRAVVLLIKGKAEQLENNERLIYTDFPLPSVIRLRHYVRVPYKEIPLTRRNILERDRHTCQYCGYKGDQLTLDHVFPRSRGGGDTWENLVTACVRCNVKKGNRTPKEAQMNLRYQPRRPYSSLQFELVKHTRGNLNQEWRKYIIGI
ncbi:MULTISPECIES: HNH endonuclease [Crocosphaera]|uniref:HNH endonuclease family protein n=2 Tax=Crocosphaera watsonii TaxID=263511 RepID=T2JQG6_CROWT|nr:MULTISPECIES: HNH endonuclease [Crocosphaera]EHJ13882.1 HNH endonuclease family protein [Crocosphaera watsonii WH 0003]MCH2245530.1 HNH endonuclease [Crocosphaera sp.]NQZ65200.1 HNH endonuclease [Crocosphaera sp.]CCQ67291.1 HNH endonuclease family protein [Crocosphaera watsonii WH 0402]